MYRSGLFNFSKGELAPALWGRVDVAAYAAGLRHAENVIILKYGGVTRRMGTQHVYEIQPPEGGWDGGDVGQRLIPFEFSIEQSYTLLFSQSKLNVFADGGVVIEEALTVEAATQANPVQITASFHGLASGDEVFFTGVEGMYELNDRILTVTVLNANTFTVAIDGTGFHAFTGDTGGIIRAGSPPAPPAPPPVPPPAPTPAPPTTTPPPYQPPRHCVSDDTLILMADGSEREARLLKVGDLVRTQHEDTFEWGDHRVAAISFSWEPVWRCSGIALDSSADVRATAPHRFHVSGYGWITAAEIGEPSGDAWVAKITVEDAHTYYSAGVLSHNIKDYDPDDLGVEP